MTGRQVHDGSEDGCAVRLHVAALMCDTVAMGFTYLQGQKVPLHMGLNLTTGKTEKRRVGVKNKGSAPEKKTVNNPCSIS